MQHGIICNSKSYYSIKQFVDRQKLKNNIKAIVGLLIVIVLAAGNTSSLANGSLQANRNIALSGIIKSNSSQSSIELGLRTQCFWDNYIASPNDFLKIAENDTTMVYMDLPWVKEIFSNFDPLNLDKPFGKGNGGYTCTFKDYINFFRVMNEHKIKIVLAISGIGSSSQNNLDFFTEYPTAAVEDQWVNPDYVDSSWSGRTFLQMYAEKINNFTNFVGIPAIVTVEDWRYPNYMMQYTQLKQLETELKTLNQTNELWMPLAMSSARVAGYNSYDESHPWTYGFNNETNVNFVADIILQNSWDSQEVYHSALNAVGWIGAQMSNLPYGTGIILKLYFGGQDLNSNNPDYDTAGMKQKIKDIIRAE